MKKIGIVYVVTSEGEVVYASRDKETAEAYADGQMYKARDEALEEMGCDDPSEKDIAEADWMAGYDGGVYEVYKVNLDEYKSGDTVIIGEDEFDYDEITGLL